MPRVKRAVSAHKKRRTVLNRAKGYYGAKSRSYRAAKEQVQHSLQYQYRDRRNKKREVRRLWITRINAAARINGLSYSVFMNGLRLALSSTARCSPTWLSTILKHLLLLLRLLRRLCNAKARHMAGFLFCPAK